MRPRRRDRAIAPALAAACYALALLQRPGEASSDTKIDLHVDPAGFLADVAALWTPSGGLGGVEAAQYSGYLWPMGPFFALLHELGIGPWLVHRLWLGTVLALGAWGVVRLIDALWERERGAAHVFAAAIYVLNPYVVVFTNRTSVTLLAWAALPWLVLLAHRGVHDARSWRWPALFALVVTSAGGGVNAAVTAFVLLGPLAMVLYEPVTGAAPWAAARRFGLRTLGAVVLASLWWLAPAAAQSAYGVDFLSFTEPAGAIWSTTSLTESFRLMGYWISYIGVNLGSGAQPYFTNSSTLLFDELVVTATLLVPALALGGFAWTRRWRYAPWFLGLALLGTLLMAVGFPEGTPLRRGVTFAYNHFPLLRVLRTTYKAGPLVALALAGLGGVLVAMALARLRGAARPALALGVAGLLALAAWPLVTGRAVDAQVTWDEIPRPWSATAAELERSLPAATRAVVLPGQLYGFYDWGATVDPILPALGDAPVAVRSAVPYGDLRGTDLLWTTDALVQQERALPGQLPPLLRLLSAGAVVTGTDDDLDRSGGPDPAAAARVLAEQGFPAPSPLPQVRTYDVEGPRRLVRVEPLEPAAVVDGSAEALAGLAAFDAVPTGSFAYAGDRTAAEIRAAAARGAEIVVSDSNRRRVHVVSRMRQNSGWTLGAADPVSEDSAVLNPFEERGTDGQTVARWHGIDYVRAPFSPGFPQFPEHRPFAAIDGDPRTFWLADTALEADRHTLEIGFRGARDVPYVDVLPQADAGAVPVRLEVAGRSHALGRGWTRVRLGLRDVRVLRLRVGSDDRGSAGAGGLAEVRVPGLRVAESLRVPRLAESALRGERLDAAALTYLFARTTGDRPRRRSSTYGVHPRGLVRSNERYEALRVRGAGDGEAGLDRLFAPPVARSWRLDAWVSVAPEARDSDIDRLAGDTGGPRFDSSGRLAGLPGRRASRAFDGRADTAWIGPWDGRAWLRWSDERVHTVRALRFEPARGRLAGDRSHGVVRRPAAVRLVWDGGRTPVLRVGGDGVVTLPDPPRARAFRLEIVAAAGAGEAVGIAELSVEGFAPARRRAPRARAGARVPCPPRAARPVATSRLAFNPGLTAMTAAGPVPLSLAASLGDLDAGVPMRAESCAPADLPAGEQRLRAPPGVLRIDHLRLRSAAPEPLARAAVIPGRVLDPGEPGRGSRSDVRLDLSGPALLVLGESWSKGWRANCDGRDLGDPVVVDGYANGWKANPSCLNATFKFAPTAPVRWIQLLSALACLLLLVVAIRSRPATSSQNAGLARNLRISGPVSAQFAGQARKAALFALGVAAVLGFCFALRTAPFIAVGVFLVLWRGVGARGLALAGGALLGVVVPALYLVLPDDDRGGFSPGYAVEHMAAHWVGVAAWVLLALAFSRAIPRGAAAARSGP